MLKNRCKIVFQLKKVVIRPVLISKKGGILKKILKISYAGTKKSLFLHPASVILIQLQSYLKLSGNFVLYKNPSYYPITFYNYPNGL
jgi:hypothetical protein